MSKKQRSATEQARAIIRPLLESGQKFNVSKLVEEHGIARRTFDGAVVIERVRLETLNEVGAIVAAKGLSLSAEKRLAAFESQLRKRFDAEVRAAVAKHWDEVVMPTYGEKIRKAEEILRTRAPLTNKEFLDLLKALHSDSSTPENRQHAFALLKNKQHLLRPEEKDPKPKGRPLPTAAELVAMLRAQRA